MAKQYKISSFFPTGFISVGVRKSTAGGGTADQLASTRHCGPIRSVFDTIHQKTPFPEEQDASAAGFHGAGLRPLQRQVVLSHLP